MRRGMLVGGCALVAGCLGPVAMPPTPADAHAQFVEAAWPALGGCAGCHGAQPTIDFLAPGTADGAYATVFAFQPAIIDLQSPAASLLVTMGKHTGPALDPASAATVLAWLERERGERLPPATESIHVGPVQLQLGALTSLALPSGGTLGFTAAAVDGGLYLSQLAITAGSTGLHVVHPLFVTRPVSAPSLVDRLDRFADVDVELAAGKVLALGGGDALFLEFDPAAPLAIHFHTLETP